MQNNNRNRRIEVITLAILYFHCIMLFCFCSNARAGDYSSSAVSMTNVTTQYLSASDANKAILRLSVTVATGGGTCAVDSVCFTMQNTADADISNAKLYYTSTTATFNTNTQVSTTVTSPTGTIIFDNIGTTGLSNTTVYYWLAVTVVASPTGCNTADAYVPNNSLKTVYSSTSARTERTPSTPNPTGAIPVKGTPCFFIGSGTSSNTTTGDHTPFGRYWEGYKNQYLVTASELTTAGVGSERSISRIAFNVANINSANGMNNFVIYMKNTSSTSLTTTWEGSLTQVYSVSTFTPAASWNEITFDNNFLWDGTSNVLIEICFNDVTTGFTNNASVYYNASGAVTTHYYRALDDADLCSNPGAGSTSSDRPNIKLRIAATSGNMVYSSCIARQGLTTNVSKSSTNNRVLDIEVVTTNPSTAISATTFTFNTTGASAPATDITNGKLFYTGTTATFATTTQVGSTVASPNGTFTIDAAKVLAEGTNYFWLTYDVPAGAVTANVVDAQCTLINVGGTDRTPSTTNPTGSRTIEGAMAYSSCTVGQVDYYAGVNVTNNEVIRISVVTTGSTSAISTTSFTLYTTGTTSPTGDVSATIDMYYTGTTSTFNTNTLFGTATDPDNNATSFTINGTQTLAEGTNYFWMAYDVPSGATVGNVIDGKCTSITVDGSGRTPTTQDPSGSRTIVISWGGGTSVAWGTSSNWSNNTVPLSTTDVVIPSGTTYSPAINGTADQRCKALTVNSGATLTLDGSGVTSGYLFIYGDNVTNNGTINRTGQQMVMFTNNSTHTFQGTGTFSHDGDGTMDLDCYVGKTSLASNISWGYVAITDSLLLNSYSLTLDKNMSAAGTLDAGTGKMQWNFASGTYTILDLPYYSVETGGTGGTYNIHTTTNETTQNLTIGGTSTINTGLNLTVNGNVSIASGATLGGNTDTITVKGNWSNSGTYTGSTSRVVFSGTSLQAIDGSANTTFYDVTINNSSNVRLDTTVTLSNLLTLTSGNIVTNTTDLLTLGVDAKAVSGASSSSYISGPVAKIKNTTAEYIFPTGKSSRYVRIAVTPAGTGQTTYQAEYFNAAYTSTTPVGSGVNHVSVRQYWQLDRTAGTTNAQLRLYWDANSNSGTVDNLAELRVCRWDGSTWTDGGQASTTGTTADGTVLSNSITSFSPFTLGSSTANNPLPITLVSFTAKPEGKRVKLEWQTAAEINNDYFTIEKTRDAKEFEQIAQVDGAGNSFSPLYYTASDETPLKGKSYYRLKQTDFDGAFTYSPLVEVDFGSSSFEIISVRPNPASNTTTICFNAVDNDVVSVKIFNTAGQLTFVQETKTVEGVNEFILDVTEYNKGMYFIELENTDSKSVHAKLVKTSEVR